jgi:thimet oligopeptidase
MVPRTSATPVPGSFASGGTSRLSLGALGFELTPEQLRTRGSAQLKAAERAARALAVGSGPRTVPGFLEPLDAVLHDVRNLSNHGTLLFCGHPDEPGRAAGRELSEAADALLHRLLLDPGLYDGLRQLDLGEEGAAAKYAVEKMLRAMRRAGVEKDAVTRDKLLSLNHQVDQVSNEFMANVANRPRGIELASADELEGLPSDYRAAHPPGSDGRVHLSTRYPDVFPILRYADRAEVRRRMFLEFLNRGYPENEPVLARLLALRHELARTLGYPSYAAFATEDKMVETPEAVDRLLSRVVALVAPGADDDRANWLARKQRSDPAATQLEPWDAAGWGAGYYDTKVRTEQFGVDLREVRRFLPYVRVREGLFALCRELFELDLRPAPPTPVWHPSVECYDAYRSGRLIGRIYLDLAPREGKFGHAACFGVRDGGAGRELPQVALLCNLFDASVPTERARLEYVHLVTLFHEFGHLLHHLFAGEVRWTYNSPSDMERDFIEAPSQLFEEWARDPATLARFAADPETGEAAPRELFERMRASEALGRATSYLRQVALSEVSLRFYARDPAGFDPPQLARELWRKYFRPWPEELHFEAAFEHLTMYSACYYTYVWSVVIARDLLRPFLERGSLTDPEVARRYAREILSIGSERRAADSVHAFLGREFSFDAFESWVRARPAPAGLHPPTSG